MAGAKLPNAREVALTVPKLKVERDNKIDDWLKSNRLEITEIKLLRKLLENTPKMERDLIFYSILSLSVFYLRSNGVKYFKIFCSNVQRSRFRASLLKYGEYYYDISVKLLRNIISSDNINFEVSLMASDLLNKVSIYEFKFFTNSLVFSRGVVTIFESLGTKYKLPKDIGMFTRFFIFASRSIKLHGYRPTMLHEYRAVLKKLAPYITRALRFQFNHLLEFVDQLIGTLHFGDNYTPDQLYNLLRKWLIILPPNLQLINFVTNPIEKLLLRFYQSLCIFLNNLFPRVNFYFLTTFRGNLTLFSETLFGAEKPTNWNNELFQSIDDYNLRICTFFYKRYNTLTLVCSRQIYNNMEEVEIEAVLSEAGEVMIENFLTTAIRFYHYPHFVRCVSFYSHLDQIQDMSQFLRDMKNIANESLYDWNKHLIQHFRSQNVLKYRMDSNDTVFFRNLWMLGVNRESVRAGPPVRFGFFFNKQESKSLEDRMAADYFELFQKATPKKTLPLELNPLSGLDVEDTNPAECFSRNAHASVKMAIEADYPGEDLQIIFSDFNNLKSEMLGEMPEAFVVPEDDADNKFYDDLNDAYWNEV